MTENHDSWFSRDVGWLEISVRQGNCLRKAGIATNGDLLRMTKEGLLRIPEFGPLSFKEVKEAIAQSYTVFLNARLAGVKRLLDD